MKYIKLEIAVDENYQETLIAELMELDFDEFQQTESTLITYIPEEQFFVGDRERIEQLLAGFPGEAYVKSEEIIADQNWNEAWEKTIQAQRIGPFLVKPTWSTETPAAEEMLLEIDPKMSFGTGYHETTRLMLRRLPEIIKEGDRVMDAGTGTGILAIAAIKLGAQHIEAFDIDEWSVTNTRENIYLNKVADQIAVQKGTHNEVAYDVPFDVILANIQYHVISEMIPFFASNLEEGGILMLSGLQHKDENNICNQLEDNNLTYESTSSENEWIAIRATK